MDHCMCPSHEHCRNVHPVFHLPGRDRIAGIAARRCNVWGRQQQNAGTGNRRPPGNKCLGELPRRGVLEKMRKRKNAELRLVTAVPPDLPCLPLVQARIMSLKDTFAKAMAYLEPEDTIKVLGYINTAESLAWQFVSVGGISMCVIFSYFRLPV